MDRVNRLTDKEVYDNLVSNTCTVGPTCKSDYHVVSLNLCADRYNKTDCENTEVWTDITYPEWYEDGDGVQHMGFAYYRAPCTWG